MVQSPFWKRIDEAGVHDIAIVGISKHAGKTTVLSRLIADAKTSGRRLAVASIGLDGERADSILGIPKPAIWVPAGTLFATAIGVHRHDHAPVRWLEPVGISSPFGEVWVGLTSEEGTLELAGVRQLSHLIALRAIFRHHGAEHVFFDGALSRMISVNTQVADGIILASGAALGGLDTVINTTKQVVRRLSVPVAIGEVGEFVRKFADNSDLVVVRVEFSDNYDSQVIQDDWQEAHVLGWSAVKAEEVWKGNGDIVLPVSEQDRVFYYGGAITDSLMLTISRRQVRCMLIAKDPSRLFVSEEVWRIFARAGHQLRVLERLPLLAVAVNPFTPFGTALNRQDLIAKMEQMVTVPVWDVMDQETMDVMDG